MVADTFELSLREFSGRAPFQPFTVELISGASFTVDHPKALIFRAGLAVFIVLRGAPHLFDHESVSRLVGAGEARSAAR